MTTTVTSKGQVTIPKSVRDYLGIHAGSRVEFRRAADGSIVIAPKGPDREPGRFASLRGHAGSGLTTDQILQLTRGET